MGGKSSNKSPPLPAWRRAVALLVSWVLWWPFMLLWGSYVPMKLIIVVWRELFPVMQDKPLPYLLTWWPVWIAASWVLMIFGNLFGFVARKLLFSLLRPMFSNRQALLDLVSESPKQE